MTLRLRTLASFVLPSDIVCDIGCDHAYLPIYLAKNGHPSLIYATEINDNAYHIALDNIQKEALDNKIQLKLTDGFKGLENTSINTLIIAGVGARTVLDIVSQTKGTKVQKLIIQANNDLPLLRQKITKYGFYLTKEKMVFDKNKWYTIGVYTKKKKRLTKGEICYGLKDSSNMRYYHEALAKLNILNNQLSFKNFQKKKEILLKIHYLKKYL